MTRSSRVWVDSSKKCTEVKIDREMNPDVACLLLKRHSAMGWANAEGTKMDIVARVESMKFEVAPESMRVETGSERPGIRRGTKKEISD